IERRHVASGLVDATQKHRDVVELHAGSPLDLGQHELGKIGIRAAEIEVKLDLERCNHRTMPFFLVDAGSQSLTSSRLVKFFFRTVNLLFMFPSERPNTTS